MQILFLKRRTRCISIVKLQAGAVDNQKRGFKKLNYKKIMCCVLKDFAGQQSLVYSLGHELLLLADEWM